MLARSSCRAAIFCLLVSGCVAELDGVPSEVAVVEQPLTVPPDFSDALVASVGVPTALAFTPDGRLLITTQGGSLRIVKYGSLLPTPALNLSAVLCSNSERGLLGIAVDPAFASNRFIYTYYTFRKHGTCPNNTSSSPVNRVSRFTLGNNDIVDPATELVLIDNIHSPAGNHNAGDLHFGKDGNLYVSVGDGGCDYSDPTRCAGNNDAARDSHVLVGKLLRIRPDGSAPSDNPFLGSDSDVCRINGGTTAGRKCRETYATGLRNPFRMAFDPNAAATRFLINDVGQNAWEEIDLGQSGADYGWNVREGFCANGSTSNCGSVPGFVNPIFAYGRGSGCASITGGAFVPNGLWPSSYDNGYLYADYVCGRVFLLKESGGTWQSTEFANAGGSSSIVAMIFGPHQGGQALYYTTYANGGEVRRIAYTAANQPPIASLTATPLSGAVPLTVAFNGTQSRDPNPGDTLSYAWTFGDGGTGTGATINHTYVAAGTFTATLVVRDQRGAASQPVSATIQAGNTAPTPTISSPAANATFRVGETITLTGSASDAQDGVLPASSLSWRVLRHHDTHNHPWLLPTAGNNLTITAPPPEDLAATTNSYLEVLLTATDSAGLSSTVSRIITPRTVTVTLASVPSGRTVTVNGSTFVTPTTITSWDGYALNIDVPAQAGYEFVSWSDGGARAHTITTPASATTYTATLRAALSVNINFQPANAAVPAGYLVDSGAAFGARGNGQSYGWNRSNGSTARDRNAANSPDQRYDTLQHMQKAENANARWELAVPNGTYSVRIVAGDASHYDSRFRINAESVLALDATPSSAARWVDRTVSVTVSDGRLTVSNASNASNNKLCFIEVRGQ
jgi:glucose/arabinose dehydrogenase